MFATFPGEQREHSVRPLLFVIQPTLQVLHVLPLYFPAVQLGQLIDPSGTEICPKKVLKQKLAAYKLNTESGM